MATIPTYKDLEDRIEVLEGKLKFWSNLASFDSIKPGEIIPSDKHGVPLSDLDQIRLGQYNSMKQGMKEAIEWNEEDKEGM